MKPLPPNSEGEYNSIQRLPELGDLGGSIFTHQSECGRVVVVHVINFDGFQKFGSANF
jgi:hypothetical protein